MSEIATPLASANLINGIDQRHIALDMRVRGQDNYAIEYAKART